MREYRPCALVHYQLYRQVCMRACVYIFAFMFCLSGKTSATLGGGPSPTENKGQSDIGANV